MNIEKFVNSKFYRGFEWFYRLIFLNLFTFVVSFSLAAIPFLVWYNNQELVYFIYLAIILFVVLFIPAFITSLIVIKYYIDDNTGNFFVLYFKYFIDTIKKIWLVELILVPIFLAVVYGTVHYWQLLGPEYYQPNAFGIFSIIAFVIEFLFVILFLLMFINLSLLVAHFQMKPSGYIILSFRFAFRYMAQTILAILVLFAPLVLMFLIGMRFVPIYFIGGISFPQFLIYYMAKNRFNYLQRNVDDIDSENKYE